MKDVFPGKQAGLSTVELLIAVAVLVVSLSATMVVAFGNQSVSIDSRTEHEALYKAQTELEMARALSRQSFDNVVSSGPTTDSDNFYTKQTTVIDINPCLKQVVTQQTWNSDKRPESVQLTTFLANPLLPSLLLDDCGGDPLPPGSNDWRCPATYGSVDLGAGQTPTGIDVHDSMAYFSTNTSSWDKPDFFVVDTTTNPYTATGINTRTANQQGNGLNALDIAGTKAYVANDDRTNQLQILDLSNLTSAPVAVTFSASAVGNAVFYLNNKVYFGTKSAPGNGKEFHIIDATTAVELGNLKVNADINQIYVSGNYAYLATSDNSQELKIIDINTPSAPTLVGSFNTSSQTEDARGLYVLGKTAYLGLLHPTGNAGPNFYIIDVTNPAAPTLKGSAVNIDDADINSIIVRGSLAFLGTDKANEEFQVWDISNPSNIVKWSNGDTCHTYNFPQTIVGMDFDNNLIYSASRSNDALRIIKSKP